jgi:hypothetical protein
LHKSMRSFPAGFLVENDRRQTAESFCDLALEPPKELKPAHVDR